MFASIFTRNLHNHVIHDNDPNSATISHCGDSSGLRIENKCPYTCVCMYVYMYNIDTV